MGIFDFGGPDAADGSEARLPEWFNPWVSGFGPNFGDNNAQVPWMALNAAAPYHEYRGSVWGPNGVSVEPQYGQQGQVPFDQLAGPSGYPGYLPNLGFLYGQASERIREGTSPLLAPMESGFNPRLNKALEWMDNAVPLLTPYTGMGLQTIDKLLQGEPLGASGALDYFSDLPAPIYARGNDPLYTAGLGALGGAGRALPTMLDPRTEGARRAALTGTAPVNTYAPIVDDIERRATERQSDLRQQFEEEAIPALAQRFATGQANYGSASERMVEDLTETYGEQQRRIEADTTGAISQIESQAAREALDRQQAAMLMGVQGAQNIFGTGANLLAQQTGLEQAAMGSQLDRSLRASLFGAESMLDQYALGMQSLPTMQQAALSPLQLYLGMGLTQRDIENARLTDLIRRDPMSAEWYNLQRFGGLVNNTQMPQTIGYSSGGNNGTSALGGAGALLTGLGALSTGFGWGD